MPSVIELEPLGTSGVNGGRVVVLEHALHETGNVIVCGSDIVEHIVDGILLQNIPERIGVVLIGPVAEATDRQTGAVALPAQTEIPLFLELRDVIAGGLRRLGAVLHPEIEHLIAVGDIA